MDDPLIEESIKIVCQYERVGVSLVQRRLSLGYVKAAQVFDKLEELGVIGHATGTEPRKVNYKSYGDYLARKAISKGFNYQAFMYRLLHQASNALQSLGEKIYKS